LLPIGQTKAEAAMPSSTIPLPAGYTVEVDAWDPAAWHEVLDLFADANIYQTWGYEVARSGERRSSRIVLRRRGAVVAAAQARIVKLPLLNIGVAYVRWGPLWRLHRQAPEPEILRVMLEALRREYSVRRGLAVRLLPYLFDGSPHGSEPSFSAGPFQRLAAETPQRTLVLSLERSEDELRAGLEQKWRNGLNKAEKSALVVEEGTGDELFERFVSMHDEMQARKGFVATSDVRDFRSAQRHLPERHKLRIFLAASPSGPAAGVVCSKVGDFGIFLYGATTDLGMLTKASYLLQWRTLQWLKDHGAVSYNLHGINPATNPGTYHFKAGLCGRNGADVRYVGTYECEGAGPSRTLIRWASRARGAYRNGHAAFRQLGSDTSR
jgi:lipid II:glycine glycyltransferase (peptidoglycan interpeptide bridge formation enzyme)